MKGAPLSASYPGLRRVSVHSGTAIIDLALPAAVPVATLIPSIVDILDERDTEQPSDPVATRYQLSQLGASVFPASTTLAQNGIRDGAVLVLSQSDDGPPVLRCDDVAEALSATLDATLRPWSDEATRLTGALAASCLTCIGAVVLVRNVLSANTTRYFVATAGVAALASFVALLGAVMTHRAYRDPTAVLTLSVIATAFAAVAGFLVVPGAAGAPHALLAAMAAAVTAVFALRLTGCGVVTLTAMSCVAIVIAIAALAGVITAAPLHAIGSVSALLCLGLLGLAGRTSIMLAGLSPQLSPTLALEPTDDTADCLATKAIRAHDWLASLVTAFSSSAAAGASVTAVAACDTTAPRLGCIVFSATTGALLLLHARSQVDRRTTLVYVIGGIVTIGATFAATAVSAPQHAPWIAAVTAVLAAGSVYLGFVAPTMSLSPVIQRGVELLGCLALVVMVPLACWICGLYGAVRGLNPT
ncbi:hypothetical protein ABH37_14310 [Mycobacterium haemophilum]|uniref:EccD-like transmembrane domain-containing protein n=1 Tax=Mycobacterium haemophilum TaxID=29311 RepID=A0A0I9XQ14_9MYCO|nr:hypothetical protein ABH39_13170 [Mycobacterium haemophilum]KLO35697.1 hypothetical protein ABH38_15155 [Mycobacterium haemophilum]KLO41161.1 hypothetical protein ABH37_14310 [Mycobacterium haemophilum]KLO49143.1 hypothetical protein ABH36_14115 [Mycobacterium haemophilum]